MGRRRAKRKISAAELAPTSALTPQQRDGALIGQIILLLRARWPQSSSARDGLERVLIGEIQQAAPLLAEAVESAE